MDDAVSDLAPTGPDPGRFLVLQHVECEPPATYEDVLVERGFTVERIQLGNGESLPSLSDHTGVISMGGPMGVQDEPGFPWMREEIALLADAASRGVPVWGVCLGAQILAAALGGKVYAGAEPEVGMSDVTLTDLGTRDPVFGSLPSSFPVFQWHGDTFTLPAMANQLVTSDVYENQAFCAGSAYGIQFHVEVTESLAEEWLAIPAYKSALESIHGPGAAALVLEELRDKTAVNASTARTIFSAWLDAFVSHDPHATSAYV